MHSSPLDETGAVGVVEAYARRKFMRLCVGLPDVLFSTGLFFFLVLCPSLQRPVEQDAKCPSLDCMRPSRPVFSISARKKSKTGKKIIILLTFDTVSPLQLTC